MTLCVPFPFTLLSPHGLWLNLCNQPLFYMHFYGQAACFNSTWVVIPQVEKRRQLPILCYSLAKPMLVNAGVHSICWNRKYIQLNCIIFFFTQSLPLGVMCRYLYLQRLWSPLLDIVIDDDKRKIIKHKLSKNYQDSTTSPIISQICQFILYDGCIDIEQVRKSLHLQVNIIVV